MKKIRGTRIKTYLSCLAEGDYFYYNRRLEIFKIASCRHILETLEKFPNFTVDKMLDLKSKDLSGKHLEGMDFRGVNLSGFDLSYANMSRCNLVDVDLCNTNLTGTYLINTDLTGADFIGANTKEARLT